tara:strand:+ start:274 stop:1989 length:1716 start_codon:yes stop_codon:yes gene_type:complete
MKQFKITLSKAAFFIPYKNRPEIILWLIINTSLILFNLISYSMLIPFFTGIINYESLRSINFLINIQIKYSLTDIQFLNYIGISAVSSILLTNILLLFNERVKFEIIKKLSLNISDIYTQNFINSDYKFLQSFQRSNVFTRLLLELETLVTNIFYNSFDLISRLILIFFIFTALLLINFQITFFSIVSFVCVISIAYFFLKKKLISYGEDIVSANEKRASKLSNISNNIILFKLYDISSEYITSFLKDTEYYYSKLTKSEVLKKFPRAILELIFFVVIISSTLIFLNYYNSKVPGQSFFNSNNILILLATYAIASYRLMPSVQQIFYLITEIRNNFPKLDKVYYEIRNLQYNKKKLLKSKVVLEKQDKKIIIRNLTYKIKNKFILKNFSIDIDPSKTYCIWGPSGSGKTTLLFLLMGFLKPDSGYISINGQHIYNLVSVKKYFSLAPEPASLIEDENIIKNILLKNKKNKNNLNKVHKMLKLLRLSHLKNRVIKNRNLSSGEVKRLSIARMLSSESKFKLLDEPLSNLDKKNEEIIINLLKYAKRNQLKGLIFVTHNHKLKKIADEVIKII